MAVLLEQVKQKLRVTWDEDERIADIIERAKNYINGKCNKAFDYETPGQHRTLMLERCFYDYHNVLKDFETNYQGELLALILDSALKKSNQSEEGAADDYT